MVGILGGTATAVASCSDDPSGPGLPMADAAVPDVAVVDVGAPDTSVTPHDAQTSDASPRTVQCSGTGTCATALALGNSMNDPTVCALLSDGTVACWGANDKSQLGRGEDASGRDSANAERVVGLKNITSLGRGCAVDKDGNAYGWGLGPWLKDPTQYATLEMVPVKLPIPPATAIDSRVFPDAIACALVDGGALCWGQNDNGQVRVPEAGADPLAPMTPALVPLPGPATPKGIFVGSATFVLFDDGTIASWGASPPLGRIASLFPDPYPGLLQYPGGTSVDIGGPDACLTAQGIAYCWGAASDSDPNPVVLPKPIVTPEPVVRIAATGYAGTFDTPRACMIGVSGDVYCYGNNLSGQVGDGTTNYALTPTKVIGLPGPAADIKTTSRTTCALLVDGRVFCWGDDENGQLGEGKLLEPRLSPGEVTLP